MHKRKMRHRIHEYSLQRVDIDNWIELHLLRTEFCHGIFNLTNMTVTLKKEYLQLANLI